MTETTSTHARPAVGTMLLAVLTLAGCSSHTEPASQLPVVMAAGRPEMHAAMAPERDATPAAVSLKVTVSLSPALANRAGPNDTVFVFARAVQGPRMPLAVARKQVRDLPATVVLDDSSALSPAMKLSSASEVIVVARVSRSGDASAQPGDLEGETGPVQPLGQAIAVSISRVVPDQ